MNFRAASRGLSVNDENESVLTIQPGEYAVEPMQ